MIEFPNVVARVQSMSRRHDGVLVTVEVTGPKGTPNITRMLRARGKALVAAGVVPTATDAVESLTVGEIKRFTEEIADPARVKSGRFGEVTTHRIIVNRG